MAEAVEGDAVGATGDHHTRAAGETGRTIFNPEEVGAMSVPMDVGRGGGDACGGDVILTLAIGDIIDLYVVEVHVAGGAIAGKGNVLAVSGIGAQGDFKQFPCAECSRSDAGDLFKGVEIVGVGHHTHIDAVVGRGVVGGETHHQGVDINADGRECEP